MNDVLEDIPVARRNIGKHIAVDERQAQCSMTPCIDAALFDFIAYGSGWGGVKDAGYYHAGLL